MEVIPSRGVPRHRPIPWRVKRRGPGLWCESVCHSRCETAVCKVLSETSSKPLFTPIGRSRWTADAAADVVLHYLSWGSRWFGKAPLMPPVVTGWWSYLLITEGAPVIRTASGAIRAPAGTLFLMHPDCPCGMEDEGASRCRTLCWIWTEAPGLDRLRPEPGGLLDFQVPGGLMRLLNRIHRDCRLEIARSDACTRIALQRLRLEMDVGIARAFGPRESDASVRRDLARSYLDQCLESSSPVRDLCEYLQVSEHALKALFHSEFQVSPQQYIQRLRMRRAEKFLQEGKLSVKEIAYKLGYRHPNDFSRAYRRHSGVNASTQKRRESGGPSARESAA